jgi:hypothetical protein
MDTDSEATTAFYPRASTLSMVGFYPKSYAKISRMVLCTPICTLPRNWQEINKQKTPLAKSLD